MTEGELDGSRAGADEPAPRRLYVTILFSDLCSSTQLGQLCDPEGLAEILRRVKAAATRVVEAHQGLVNQFYGDGILVVFGLPGPREDDVKRAVEAALALHAAVREVSFDDLLPRSFEIRLHSGMHAGLVLVEAGDPVTGHHQLVGDALNTAAALSDAAGESAAAEKIAELLLDEPGQLQNWIRETG